MESYFFDKTQNKAYKVETDPNGQTWSYYVQVKKFFDTGSFIHARGRDSVSSPLLAGKLLDAMGAVRCTEDQYVNLLKDYFAIDKKVREQFIEKYNL